MGLKTKVLYQHSKAHRMPQSDTAKMRYQTPYLSALV